MYVLQLEHCVQNFMFVLFQAPREIYVAKYDFPGRVSEHITLILFLF